MSFPKRILKKLKIITPLNMPTELIKLISHKVSTTPVTSHHKEKEKENG